MHNEYGNLKPGLAVDCPGCGVQSVVKVARRLDGWQCVGQYYACALCGHELAVIGDGPGDDAEAPGKAGLDRLASFLGGEVDDAPRSSFLDGAEANPFCRDCRNFLKHPFQSRCLLHERDVEPMDDCADFERVVMNEGEHDEQA